MGGDGCKRVRSLGDMAGGSVDSDRQAVSDVMDGDGFTDYVYGSVSLYKYHPSGASSIR